MHQVRLLDEVKHLEPLIRKIEQQNMQASEEIGIPYDRVGYISWCLSPGDGSLCCIKPYIYTWAIVDGIDEWSHKRRWCYSSLAEAISALLDWRKAGGGHPVGFVRAVLVDG